MAFTPKSLIASQQLSDSNATYYTATNVRTIIDKLTLTNTTAGAVTATIDLVDAGGSAGVSERILSARSIAAGETYSAVGVAGHILNPGDSIQGLASAAASLTIRASGREITGL